MDIRYLLIILLHNGGGNSYIEIGKSYLDAVKPIALSDGALKINYENTSSFGDEGLYLTMDSPTDSSDCIYIPLCNLIYADAIQIGFSFKLNLQLLPTSSDDTSYRCGWHIGLHDITAYSNSGTWMQIILLGFDGIKNFHLCGCDGLNGYGPTSTRWKDIYNGDTVIDTLFTIEKCIIESKPYLCTHGLLSVDKLHISTGRKIYEIKYNATNLNTNNWINEILYPTGLAIGNYLTAGAQKIIPLDISPIKIWSSNI